LVKPVVAAALFAAPFKDASVCPPLWLEFVSSVGLEYRAKCGAERFDQRDPDPATAKSGDTMTVTTSVNIATSGWPRPGFLAEKHLLPRPKCAKKASTEQE